MSYKGKYKPSNIRKYKGDPTQIIYRSLWERRFMVYCDTNENILEWGSEEICLPYRSPIDNRVHRYFPDFYIKVKESNSIKKYLIEVKPKNKQLLQRNQEDKQKVIFVKHTSMQRIKRSGKAKEFCADRMWEFKVITEIELGIKK